MTASAASTSTGALSTAERDAAVAVLRSPATVRARARTLTARARAGESAWFTVDETALAGAADVVADLTRRRHPDLDIPVHSRWRHFDAGGVGRTAALHARLPDVPLVRARALVDLAVVSVLLDAGAGPDWSFREPGTGVVLGRSEGLAVAGWHAFVDGAFASDGSPRVDADGLAALTPERLAGALQVGPGNPVVGLAGRTALLHRLGDALAADPATFGPDGRPGGIVDVVARGDVGDAGALMTLLLDSLASVWRSGSSLGGVPLGDCWRHDALAGPATGDGWMPFHKLTQWLTYSLLEPLADAGVPVTGVDALTALPEYRNGGLLLDTGVLRLRRPADAARTWAVGDELVVEWRALTVALLDELAAPVRERLGVDAATLPLARILEGGTWAAGRDLAGRLRGGLPPLRIDSDGTVF